LALRSSKAATASSIAGLAALSVLSCRTLSPCLLICWSKSSALFWAGAADLAGAAFGAACAGLAASAFFLSLLAGWATTGAGALPGGPYEPGVPSGMAISLLKN